jgi:uncharacterized protein YutE (UPF0331/DUF86 family)
VTYLVERLADIRRHLEHLRAIRPRVGRPEDLETDLSLHNDVLFSLLTVVQGVIDVAGELAGRAGIRFDDYVGAIRALRRVPGVPADLVDALVPLPGFRNVLIHEYVELDYRRVVEALDHLDPIEQFVQIVARLEDPDRGARS